MSDDQAVVLIPATQIKSDETSRLGASSNLSEESEFANLPSAAATATNNQEPSSDDSTMQSGSEDGVPPADREVVFGAGAAEKRQAARDRGEKVQLDSFPDNSIKTARYTWYNFLPRNLFEQFRRIANFYFLIISILMIVGYHTTLYESSLSGYTTVGTLALVVAVTMVMSLKDDLNRHRQDLEVNTSKATILTEQFPCGVEREWRELAVGDLVLVRKDEPFPADLLALGSSNADNLCYVETKNIDGESNLKVRNTLPEVQAYITANGTGLNHSCRRAITMQGNIGYEPANNSIYTFNGFLECQQPNLAERASLGGRHLLLRGSTLRNTRWSIGLVVYTGKDTKVVRNSRETPAKMSMIEKVINQTLWIILLIQLAFAIVCDALFNISDAAGFKTAWYLNEPNVTTQAFIFPGWLAYLFTFIILFNNLVPISLYVTVEFCNVFQAALINRDKKMIDPSTGTPALCRSTNLCQELGQIEYIFSDKTGTLTQNLMTFKSLSVGGTVYTDEGPGTSESDFECKALQAALNTPGVQRDRLRVFFEVMAVAHTVVVEQFDDEDDDDESDTTGSTGKAAVAAAASAAQEQDAGISYQAESPDELAFVESAAAMGFVFTRRIGSDLFCMIDGKEVAYTICAVNEFNSTRKRQSCVVRTPEGKTMLFCKGADNIMFDRADKNLEGQEEYIAHLNTDLYDFACKGLRTLVMGVRELPPAEFEEFMDAYNKASSALDNRSEKLVEVAERVETNLKIVGVTAIEDKLQDDVEECISSLHTAKIKLWVLTGDKLETAINIGFSCKVLLPSMKIIKIRCADDSDEAKARMLARFHSTLKQIDNVLGRSAAKSTAADDYVHEKYGAALTTAEPASQTGQTEEEEENSTESSHVITKQDIDDQNLALVVTGEALHAIMSSEEQTRNLLRLTESCSVVIGCRVSPAQKAQMVKMVQEGYMPNPPVTLAIGDGANDVPMIQQAQVGVGVCGREGRQAVNSSDFAVSQFKHLKRLLIVHGRWNYRRICKVILYSFYKNITLTLVLFYYSFYTGYSGTSLFESTSYMLFNVCFCSLPIIAVGWFDKDMSEETVLAFPEMFISGRLGQDLNVRAMIEVVLYSIIHSLILFYVPYLAYDGFLNQNIGDQLSYGTVSFTSLVLVMNVRVAFITHTWNWVVHLFLWGSVVFYILFLIVLSIVYSYSAEYYFVAIQCFASPLFWAVCLSCMLTVLLVDIIVENVRLQLRPGLIDIGREIDNDVAESRRRKAIKRQSSYLLGNRDGVEIHSAKSREGIEANHRAVSQYINNALQKKAATVDRDGAGFYYPQNDIDDIANDDNLDDAAELKKGRSISSHGFNFDYAEGSDEHFGTAQRRITMRRKTQSSSSLRASQRPVTSSIDLDAGLLEQSTEKDEEKEKENELMNDPSCKGKCYRMGLDVMNQTLPAWQPVVVVKWTATTLLLTGALFFAVGIPAADQCLNSNEHKVWYEGKQYTDQGNLSAFGDSVNCFGHNATMGKGGFCTVQITVDQTMPGPVYVMYELDNFYQNYFSYSQSRSYAQTHGDNVSTSVLATTCKNYLNVSGPGLWANATYAPCGLVAHSFFNDSISLVNPDINMNESGIAWASDRSFLFQNPKFWPELREFTADYEFLYESYNGSGYEQALYEENYENEHFIVWMRASAFSEFKKPYAIIEEGITVEDAADPVVLTFNISNVFNVDGFNGSKAINVLTITPLGGKGNQLYFAFLQLILGSIAVIAALALLMQEAFCPRNVKKRALDLSIHYTRDAFLNEEGDDGDTGEHS